MVKVNFGLCFKRFGCIKGRQTTGDDFIVCGEKDENDKIRVLSFLDSGCVALYVNLVEHSVLEHTCACSMCVIVGVFTKTSCTSTDSFHTHADTDALLHLLCLHNTVSEIKGWRSLEAGMFSGRTLHPRFGRAHNITLPCTSKPRQCSQAVTLEHRASA